MAAELVTDDAPLGISEEELRDPSGDQGTAAPEFRKTVRIRVAIREMLSSRGAAANLRDASVRRRHADRTFSQGQRVYVWRRQIGERSGKTGKVGKDRWIGHGVVILQDNHAVWAGMRRRIWKCNSDQIRAATLGAQLLRQEVLSQHLFDLRKAGSWASAVDITGERPPRSQRVRRSELRAETTPERGRRQTCRGSAQADYSRSDQPRMESWNREEQRRRGTKDRRTNAQLIHPCFHQNLRQEPRRPWARCHYRVFARALGADRSLRESRHTESQSRRYPQIERRRVHRARRPG